MEKITLSKLMITPIVILGKSKIGHGLKNKSPRYACGGRFLREYEIIFVKKSQNLVVKRSKTQLPIIPFPVLKTFGNVAGGKPKIPIQVYSILPSLARASLKRTRRADRPSINGDSACE